MTSAEAAQRLQGVIPAIIVPLTEAGSPDHDLLAAQAAYLGSSGVRGIFVGGTTGEGAYFSTAEKLEIFSTVRQSVPRGVVLCAACIQPSTAQVIEEIRAFERQRPDYIVAVAPYYLGVDQSVVLEHFRALAESAFAPLILYNIPQNTHNPARVETILELAAVDNVAGVKDSSGDFVSFSRGVLSPLPGPFTWIQGEDYLEAASYLLGCRGVVTGLGNVWIEPYLRMHAAALQGDAAAVLSAQTTVNELYGVLRLAGPKGVAGIKAACELLGRGQRWTRNPAMALRNEEVEQLRPILERLGVR
ncbi:MAG: dihydrodipicolinate synthase family protein [Spirochaetales bacterium]|nr:dihydrodipicolinate synthase family protein [Spirochaetales bacterium]